MCEKVAYPSPGAAYGALRQIQSRRRRDPRRKNRTRPVEKGVYKCPEPGCKMWHLTSQRR